MRTIAAALAIVAVISSPVSATGESTEAVPPAAEPVADIAAGEETYKRECRACHGPTGKGLASYPKLRDQSVEYLVDKLLRYRAGERFGPNTPLMAPRAKKLSDADIANISAFIVALD